MVLFQIFCSLLDSSKYPITLNSVSFILWLPNALSATFAQLEFYQINIAILVALSCHIIVTLPCPSFMWLYSHEVEGADLVVTDGKLRKHPNEARLKHASRSGAICNSNPPCKKVFIGVRRRYRVKGTHCGIYDFG